MYTHSRLIDQILNRERFGHFGEQKLPPMDEHFFRRCDRHCYRITYDRPAKGRVFDAKRCCHFYCACTVAMMRCCQIYCARAVAQKYWCCALERSTTVLPVLLRMRSRKTFLVCRGCHIYHAFVRCTALLSILLRMRSSREFLVLRSCQIHHTIVICTRLVAALRVPTRFTGCKQGIVEIETIG